MSEGGTVDPMESIGWTCDAPLHSTREAADRGLLGHWGWTMGQIYREARCQNCYEVYRSATQTDRPRGDNNA